MIEIEKGEGIEGEFASKVDTAARAAFMRLDLSGKAKAELDFVTEDEIRELNRIHRQKDKPTDVLSFPLTDGLKPFVRENYPYDTDEDGFVRLGNIIICPPYAAREADEYGVPTMFQLVHLFVHGLLHLLGYDHADEQTENDMRAIEKTIIEMIEPEWSEIL